MKEQADAKLDDVPGELKVIGLAVSRFAEHGIQRANALLCMAVLVPGDTEMKKLL
ncbi:hypothetical protein [Paenibacillus senegalensis]|uniref:hypothetical protein n=1 Tax=Paenibacillus senegalensis TaxID=1465766 RepID=UPI0002D2A85C|nr:hypothetical protein [Paenibacillus senegalensis]